MNKRGLPESLTMKHDLHYVEELFHDESGVVGRYLPIASIKPNPHQPRQSVGDLSELVASIREKGVLEPLLVRRHEDGYQLIAGERRWRACKEAGITVVPCIEKNVDDKEMLEIALVENLQRRDLTPFEEAEGLQTLVDRYGYTHADVAKVIGKSRTSVTEVLSLNQMPSEVKEECRRADISSKSLLLQIVRQPDTPEMLRLVERISRENMTRQQVREEEDRKKGKQNRFVYRSQGDDYELKIYFDKNHASLKEIRQALEDTLNNLK